MTLRRCTDLRSQLGQTTAEFALVIPVMMIFLLGIFQIGTTYFNDEALRTSARDGARAASIHTGATLAQLTAYAEAAIKANGTGLDPSDPPLHITVQCAPCDQGDIITVTATYPWKLGIYDFAATGTLSTKTQLRME